MTLTSTIEALHARYPGEFRTGVKSLHSAIFHNNPWVSKVENGEVIEMHYSSIQRSNQTSSAFINGYLEFLSTTLALPIAPTHNRPVLYLEDKEKSWISQVQELLGKPTKFWLVNAGIKSDFTTKSWPVEYYQEVVDATHSRIQWVQIGSDNDIHPRLKNVLNLVGKTELRQLIRLVWHSSGGLGPVTLLQHLCAAWEKPYFCIVGGREPLPWIQYPLQQTFHTMGQFDCCRTTACWKSRVVVSGKKDDEKNQSLCELPVLDFSRPSPRCTVSIKPSEVIERLERYL